MRFSTPTENNQRRRNREVIDPKYRTFGLGSKLIRETLPLAGTPYVEMVAVMAKYNQFAEKAGKRKRGHPQERHTIRQKRT